MGFKFKSQSRTKEFEFYSTPKCIHDTVQQGQQHVKNYTIIQLFAI